MYSKLNRFLDELPLTGFFTAHSAPAFRSCGVAGFYIALLTTIAAALIARLPVHVAALPAGACAVSFYAYALLRKRITGRECLVLLEHVWVAAGCSAAALWMAGQPVLPWLDAIAPGLCFFLAAGRAGCLLVGCCHGVPSSIGIVYPPAHAAEGFPDQLVGVRLFPVQLIELASLVGIGAIGLVLLPTAAPGMVLAWCSLAYAIARYGLEGVRGDRRPQWLGLSQPRWMSLIETVAVMLWLGSGSPPAVRLLPAPAAAAVIAVAFRREQLRRRLFSEEHLRAISQCLDLERLQADPRLFATDRGVRVAASAWNPECAHVSLSFASGEDLRLLCEVAARAFPGVHAQQTRYRRGVLHVFVPLFEAPPKHSPLALFGVALRSAAEQSDADRPIESTLRAQAASQEENPVQPWQLRA